MKIFPKKKYLLDYLFSIIIINTILRYFQNVCIDQVNNTCNTIKTNNNKKKLSIIMSATTVSKSRLKKYYEKQKDKKT